VKTVGPRVKQTVLNFICCDTLHFPAFLCSLVKTNGMETGCTEHNTNTDSCAAFSSNMIQYLKSSSSSRIALRGSDHGGRYVTSSFFNSFIKCSMISLPWK